MGGQRVASDADGIGAGGAFREVRAAREYIFLAWEELRVCEFREGGGCGGRKG